MADLGEEWPRRRRLVSGEDDDDGPGGEVDVAEHEASGDHDATVAHGGLDRPART